MNNIVIAFPKPEIAQNIKKILSQSGYHVAAVCTSGGMALEQAQQLEEGVLICGSRFADMHYTQLCEYLPPGFSMVLVASRENILDREVHNLITLAMPLKVHELLQTLRMMDDEQARRRRQARKRPKQRSPEEQALLDQAKGVLMTRNGFSEEEAHRYLQKRSMENGTGIVETAQMILSLMG